MKTMLPFLLFLPLCFGHIALAQPFKVGGACEYTDVPGTASILSVEPLPPAQGVKNQKNMRVLFRFTPTGDYPPQVVPLLSKTHELRRPVDQMLNDLEVERARLRPGLTLPCTLKLIRKGTCTPTIFEFPTLFPKP